MSNIVRFEIKLETILNHNATRHVQMLVEAMHTIHADGMLFSLKLCNKLTMHTQLHSQAYTT